MSERLWELEPTPAEMRALVDAAMRRIVSHVASLPDQPAGDLDAAEAETAALALRAPMPEEGRPLEDLLDVVFDRAAPRSWNAAGPGYLAYIPGGGIFESAVADLIADSLNRYTGVSAAAPCLCQLEANVIRWFCDIVGYGEGAYGFLTTGGSLANFSAVVAARHEKLRDEGLARGTVYVSDQIHHSVEKAAHLAGIPRANVRRIPSDAGFRIRLDAVRDAVARDRAAGLSPFLLVGSAGTVNTGAVDDLAALADIARDTGLWLHVDGAYGGFFTLTPRGRRAMAGIERADSVSLDPHKGLFLPYGTGCLLAKDGHALARSHGYWADYLPQQSDTLERMDVSRLSPELTRAFRGLRVWLPFMLHVVGAWRRALDEKLDLARVAAEGLRAIEHVRVVAEPQLSVVPFRLEPPGVTGAARDEMNRDLLRRIVARGRVWISGTNLPPPGTGAEGGRPEGWVLRFCVLSFRTHADRIEAALEDVRAAAAALL
jgi:aromatic-L-amino-acid decarboxylase